VRDGLQLRGVDEPELPFGARAMGPSSAADAERCRRVTPGRRDGYRGRCPDYLSPPPDAPHATFRDELERLEATPPEIIYEEVEALMQEEAELLCRYRTRRCVC
jgi:hypothetical protein